MKNKIPIIVGEVWKDVAGYEGCYSVSNYGVIKSVKRVVVSGIQTRTIHEKIISAWVNHRGYELVTIYKDGVKTSIPVHIIVAKAFVLNPENKPEVNHKKGNKRDNRSWMLEWATRLENMHHSIDVLGKHMAGEAHYNAKLSVAQVVEMRRLFKTGDYTKAEIGRMFGVCRGHAVKVINNKSWETLKTA